MIIKGPLARFICLRLLPVLLAAALAPAGAWAAYGGPIEIKKVSVQGLKSIPGKELLYLLGIEEGRRLNPEDLRRGIKRAFRIGLFDHLSVQWDDEDVDVLIVSVREKSRIAKIKIKGNRKLKDRFIKKHVGFEEDDIVRDDLLGVYSSKVVTALRERGYPDAEVRIEIKDTRNPYRKHMVVSVNEGAPAIIRTIEVVGRPWSEVAHYLNVHRRSVYDQFKLKKGLVSLEKRYRKKGYLMPQVGPYTFSEGVLHINVQPGDKLDIRIKGNQKVRTKTLMKAMPFHDAGEVNYDVIGEAVSKVISTYNERGYPDAQVAPVLSRDGETITLSFFIHEGRRVMVKEINLLGLTVPEGRLKKLLSTRAGEVYNPDNLKRDIQIIKDFYNSLGHIDVEVSEPVVSIKDGNAEITMHVSEGALATIDSVTVSGIEAIGRDELYAQIDLSPGQPYNEVDIADARRRVVTFLRGSGYPSSSVEVSVELLQPGQAAVRFVVQEGEKLLFGKTLLKGNRTVKGEVIRRELQYKEGEAFDKLLLLGTRQKVYKVGLFADVNVEVVDRYEDRADVLVTVMESKAGAIEFGAGYGEYDLFRGFVDLSYKNLMGMNRSVSLRAEASSLATRYILNYHEPWFLGTPMPLRAYLLWESRKERNIDTGAIKYRVERVSGGIGLEKSLGKYINAGLLYEASHTKTFDVAPDIILSKEDTGTLIISSITPSLTFDSRDNPFDPRSGIFAGVSLEAASYLILSETDFLKLIVFVNSYLPISKRIVFASTMKYGVAEGLRDTTELPLIERFFLGGRTTVRGYSQDSLGPKSALSTPIGGNLFMLLNCEFRLRVAGKWRVVSFMDSGAVWINRNDIDLADVKFTAGLGIQYNTPVGPIRLDYGHKLNREAGESIGEVHFSIGHSF